MIDIRSGHLAAGRWKIKSENGISFLYHRLSFSPEPEFRIASKDISSVEVEEKKGNEFIVRINFSQDRYAVAQCNEEDLQALASLCTENNDAPTPPAKNQQSWVIAICLVVLIAAIYELSK